MIPIKAPGQPLSSSAIIKCAIPASACGTYSFIFLISLSDRNRCVALTELLTFVPLTKDNRLCAKEIIGNRANLTKWQDDFHAYMVEKYPDLERGESASKTSRKHIPTRLFKQAVSLSKQARAIEATLDGMNPLNAGKKKEEALSLLKKWFPQMENFSGQLKKYKVTINDLLAENEQLEARAKASEKGKMKDTMERAKLESELKDIQRLVDRIPPEVLAELKRQQRHTKER